MKRAVRPERNNRGLVLISVFIILSILLVMCVSLVTSADTEIAVSENNLLESQCRFLALRGLSEALSRIKDKPDYVSTNDFTDALAWRPSQTGNETKELKLEGFAYKAIYGLVVLDDDDPPDGYPDRVLCTARIGWYAEADMHHRWREVKNGDWVTESVVSLQADIHGLITSGRPAPFAREITLNNTRPFDDGDPHLYVWD